MQPQAFDQLDPDEALDLVERLEKMQLERDKAMFEYIGQQFETTHRMIAATVGVRLPESGGDVNERGELNWYRDKKEGEEVTDRG